MKPVPLDNQAKAYAYIRDRILSRAYVPGERLPGQEIAAALGLSRTPIREAFGLLEQAGLVEKTGWGFFVRTMTLQDIEDLFDVRELLELEAARKTLRRVSDTWIAELEAMLKRSREHLQAGRPIESILAARQLHFSIAERTGNRVLINMLASINDQVQLVGGSLISRFPARATEVLAENESILEALRNRAADTLAQAIRAHIRRSRDLHLSNHGEIRAA